MAKNVTLFGASYSDVPAVDLPQTGGGTARFIADDELSKKAEIVYKDITITNVTLSALGQTSGWSSLDTPSGYEALSAKTMTATVSGGNKDAYVLAFIAGNVLNYVAVGEVPMTISSLVIRVYYVKTSTISQAS